MSNRLKSNHHGPFENSIPALGIKLKLLTFTVGGGVVGTFDVGGGVVGTFVVGGGVVGTFGVGGGVVGTLGVGGGVVGTLGVGGGVGTYEAIGEIEKRKHAMWKYDRGCNESNNGWIARTNSRELVTA